MRWWIPEEILDDQSVSVWDDTYAYTFSSIFDQTGEDGLVTKSPLQFKRIK